MRIAIIEDHEAERVELVGLCARWAADGGRPASVEAFASGAAFLDAWQTRRFGIVLLDGFLEGRTTGLDVARTMRAHKDDAALVFVTVSPDFAVPGYEVRASGYLVKPVAYPQLAAALDRALEDALPRSLGEPVELCPGDDARIDPRSLALVRSSNHHVDLLLANGREVRVRQSFSAVRDALCDGDDAPSPFLLSARGILVNLAHVIGIEETAFVLSCGRRAPISKAHRREARDAYATFVFSQMTRDA